MEVEEVEQQDWMDLLQPPAWSPCCNHPISLSWRLLAQVISSPGDGAEATCAAAP